MKWMLAAWFCAAATAAAAAPAGPDPDWAKAIDAQGWVFVGNSDIAMMFIKPAPSPAGSLYRRVYVRFEDAIPFDRQGFASLASLEVDEIDCERRMTRIVSSTRYAGRNMQGKSQADTPEAPEWKAEAKGSFGAGILSKACSRLT